MYDIGLFPVQNLIVVNIVCFPQYRWMINKFSITCTLLKMDDVVAVVRLQRHTRDLGYMVAYKEYLFAVHSMILHNTVKQDKCLREYDVTTYENTQ